MEKTIKIQSDASSLSCSSCSLVNICLPAGLTEEEVELFAQYINKEDTLSKSTYLFHKGDTLRGLYAVKSGGVKTLISTASGKEQILEFHLPGDLLGFDGLGDRRYNCDAVALTDSLICHLATDDLVNELFAKIPNLVTQVLHLGGQELSSKQNLLLSLGQLKAEDRMALFLMSLASRYKTRGFSDKAFNLPMTRRDLANYLGLAVETVSRIFSQLQDSGCITIKRQAIKILDKERLCAMAQLNCKHSFSFA